MIRLLSLIAVALLPFAAYSHAHYCDHIHESNGKVTWHCDDVKRPVSAELMPIELNKVGNIDRIANESNVIDVKDEQIPATGGRGLMRVLRVTALVGNKGYPSVTASVRKVDANTAAVKFTVFVGRGVVQNLTEFIVPIENQLQGLGFDPGVAKLILEDFSTTSQSRNQDPGANGTKIPTLFSSKAYFVCSIIENGNSRENDGIEYEKLFTPQRSIYDPSNTNKMHFGNEDIDISLTVGSDNGKDFVLLIHFFDKSSHMVTSVVKDVTEGSVRVPNHENLFVACHDEA